MSNKLSPTYYLIQKSVRILYTSHTFRCGGVAYPHLPSLIDENNEFIWEASDWLLYERVDRGLAQGTVERKAYGLRRWFEYIRSIDLTWTDVTDNTVRSWRKSMMDKFVKCHNSKIANAKMIRDKYTRDLRLARLGSTRLAEFRHRASINFDLDTVTEFYLWAQRTERTDFRIIGFADLARGIAKPPLSINPGKYFDQSSGDFTRVTASSPWRFKTASQSCVQMPSRSEIEIAKDAILKISDAQSGVFSEELISALEMRNGLIFEMGFTTTLRRAEVVELTIDDIPNATIVERHLMSGQSYLMDIIGKGNKLRAIRVPPYLLEQLRLYIDEYRSKLLLQKRSKKRLKSDRSLFPSIKTGCALKPRAVHSLMKKISELGDIYIRFHGLRRRGATEILARRRELNIELFGSADDASLLVDVKDSLGHSPNTNTARSYLQIAKLEEEMKQSKARSDPVVNPRRK